jgi:hypothetical protein
MQDIAGLHIGEPMLIGVDLPSVRVKINAGVPTFRC